MITFIDYHKRDYYPNGNLRRERRVQRIEIGPTELATICYYGVKAFVLVGQVVIGSLIRNNPHQLK